MEIYLDFTESAVLPGRCLAILAHLLLYSWWSRMSLSSSSSEKAARLMFGSSRDIHLSRHAFPVRPGTCLATLSQSNAPPSKASACCCWTARRRRSFSSSSQCPFFKFGIIVLCQRWRHCVGRRWMLFCASQRETSVQCLSPSNSTACRSNSDSWSSHFPILVIVCI